jgi:hypothetical protein
MDLLWGSVVSFYLDASFLPPRESPAVAREIFRQDGNRRADRGRMAMARAYEIKGSEVRGWLDARRTLAGTV